MSGVLRRLGEAAAVVVAKTALDYLIRGLDGDDVSPTPPRRIEHTRAKDARAKLRAEAARRFGVVE